MKRMTYILTAAVLPASLAAQQDPAERLGEVLPPSVAAQVLEQIEIAANRELPVQAVANLALEGVAKGRSGPEVLAAVELLLGDMGSAQAALQAAGHAPAQGEVEAATAAMRMGVGGAEIGALASSQPSGRTLVVPLLVIGSLAERGLASDEALVAVRDRLSAGLDDEQLLSDVPGVALGLGINPNDVGLAIASGTVGFQVPVAGVSIPVGPQSEAGSRPGRPDNVPGRGGPPTS